MKKLNLVLVLLLSLASSSILFFGASMRGQASPALLLYTRYDAELEINSLYVLNAITGDAQKLSDLEGFTDAGWSPDGRVWLVDSPVENTRRLRFFDAETGAESVFAESLYFDPCQPSLYWSANGAEMAYLTGHTDELSLKLVNLADGSSYQISVAQNEAPFWSPDANYLLISYLYGIAPARLFTAADGHEILQVQRFLGFSPDSRYLSYQDENEIAFLYELASGGTIELGANWDEGAWSPSGRYFIMDNYTPNEQLAYYDVQTSQLASIDLAYPIDFATWDNADTALLYSDFSDFEERPTRLIAYHLAEATSNTILENTAWIAGMQQSGDWLAIRYSSSPSEEHYAPTNQVLFYNGSQRITAELTIEIPWFRSNIAALANDWGFLIRADTGLYRFDNQDARLEIINEENTTMPFWTADGSYLAFLSMNEAEVLANLSLWDAVSETARIVQQSDRYYIQILGWQGSALRESLLYCGEG